MGQSIVDPTYSTLTPRERFRRQMHYQTIDRGVHLEFGYLTETIERWRTEGLPPEVAAAGPFASGPGSVEAYFGCDNMTWLPVSTGLNPGFAWHYEVLEKHAGREIRKWDDGTIAEEKTGGVVTIPRYIKHPISSRDDWKRYKERLDPGSPDRHKVAWKALGDRLRHETLPVGLLFGSFYGVPRDWLGFDQISLLLYDDRDLVEEIVEALTVLMESQLTMALREVQVDCAAGWEDICFRNGPMISPQMFSEIVIPRLKRVTSLLRQHGCDVIWTDCDGDIRKLVPLWLDAGLNCMFPLEVHPGSDPVQLRKQYGKQILLRGGLAKFEFSKTRKEILAEVRRVEKVFEEGGYIPHGDHRIPEDVPYDNYRYYIKEKLTMMGWRKEDIAAIWPLATLK